MTAHTGFRNVVDPADAARFRSHGWWGDMTVSDYVRAHVITQGDKVFDGPGAKLGDVTVVQACGLVFAATYVGLNVLADLLVILANPRLRYPR